jgi:dienelactone hydrolase
MSLLRRAVKFLRAISLCGIAGVAVLLGFAWIHNHRRTILPIPSGPFAVGRITYDWRDANQQDAMAPRPGTPREIFAWIWYPAAAQGSNQTADYFPKPWTDALYRQRGWFLTHFMWKDFARVQTHSIAGAELSGVQREYPVVLMRAGLAAEIAGYSNLAEDLASHGYVVVGFDAPYRSTLVVFPDGRIIARTPENNAELVGGKKQKQLGTKLVQTWSGDTSFAVDRLEDLNANDPTGRFKGRLDLTRVGAFGHSLGGATTLEFCHDDARCKAGVDVDGAPLGSAVADGVKQPFLFLLSDHSRESKAETDSVEADVRSIYGRLPQDKRLWIGIRGAGHYGFADLRPLPLEVAHWLHLIPLDSPRQIFITRDCLHTFFDVYLKGAPASSLKELRKYPEIENEH